MNLHYGQETHMNYDGGKVRVLTRLNLKFTKVGTYILLFSRTVSSASIVRQVDRGLGLVYEEGSTKYRTCSTTCQKGPTQCWEGPMGCREGPT